MTTNQPQPVDSARITALIEQLAREFTEHSGEAFGLTVALTEITVWRTVNGQTADQITAFLDAHVTPGVRADFVAWVVGETGRRLAQTPDGGAR